MAGATLSAMNSIATKLMEITNEAAPSFEQHEKSHAEHVFKEKFDQVAEYRSETHEVGYKMLWQGVTE